MTIPMALTAYTNNGAASSYTTSAALYHGNDEQLVAFVFTGTGTAPTVTTPTLTFVEIAHQNGLYVFRAMGTVDATEAVTVAFSSTPTSIAIIWDELLGPLTGANGANGIITSNNVTQAGPSGTSVTLTCPNSVTNAANGIMSWVGIGNNNRTFTTSAGYTQVNSANANNTVVSAINTPESSLTNIWTVVGGFNNTYLGVQTEIGVVVWAGTYMPPKVIRQAPQRAAVR